MTFPKLLGLLDTDTDDDLRRLCKHGIDQVRAGKYDAINFDLFNLHEVTVVKEFMSEHAPEIPFRTTRLV